MKLFCIVPYMHIPALCILCLWNILHTHTPFFGSEVLFIFLDRFIRVHKKNKNKKPIGYSIHVLII